MSGAHDGKDDDDLPPLVASDGSTVFTLLQRLARPDAKAQTTPASVAADKSSEGTPAAPMTLARYMEQVLALIKQGTVVAREYKAFSRWCMQFATVNDTSDSERKNTFLAYLLGTDLFYKIADQISTVRSHAVCLHELVKIVAQEPRYWEALAREQPSWWQDCLLERYINATSVSLSLDPDTEGKRSPSQDDKAPDDKDAAVSMSVFKTRWNRVYDAYSLWFIAWNTTVRAWRDAVDDTSTSGIQLLLRAGTPLCQDMIAPRIKLTRFIAMYTCLPVFVERHAETFNHIERFDERMALARERWAKESSAFEDVWQELVLRKREEHMVAFMTQRLAAMATVDQKPVS